MGIASRSALNCALAAVILCAPCHLAMAVVVRYEFSLNGSSFGTVDVRLLQTAMPRTVTNFLHYVDDNDWDGSFIHRRAALADSGVAVIQGGGYKLPSTGMLTTIDGQLFLNHDDVLSDAPIADEPGNGVAGPPNVRGTIAMAKSGPNTVTNEWFFNTIDNTVLDDPTNPGTGGFAAFGSVLGSGMTVVDNIWNLPRVQVGGPFTNLPVFSVSRVQSQVNVFNADVVLVTDIRRLNIPAGDYNFDGTVNATDYNIWKTDFGSTTKAEADGNGDGVVNAADYTVWRNTFGQSSVPGGGSGGLAGGAVPEPASALLCGVAATCWVCLHRSFRNRRRQRLTA